jgi:ligand-binding sensor domain-containing protein
MMVVSLSKDSFNIPCSIFALLISLCFSAASGASNTEENWKIYPREWFPDLEITTIVQDSIGDMWFGTRGGLLHMTASEDWEVFNMETTGGGLAGDSILYLLVDKYGDLLIGTNRGLSIYSNGNWQSYTRESTNGGLPNNVVWSISLDDNNDKWIATENGFAHLKGTIWTTYTGDKIIGLIPDYKIYAIAWENDESIWLGTVAGLIKFNGSSYKLFNRDNTSGGLPNNFVTRIQNDQHGALWIGTQEGLAVYAKNKWQTYLPKTKKEIAGKIVYFITLGKGDDVWIGFKGGASRFTGNDWEIISKLGIAKTYDRAHGPPAYHILSIMPGENGEVWYGTRQGLCKHIPVK